MKVAKSAFTNYERSAKDQPILPLVDDEEGMEIDDSISTTFKLRSIPADANSSKYSFKVQIIDGNATPRQAIKWGARVRKVFAGLAMNTHSDQHNLLLELCSGSAKTAYDTAAKANRAVRHTNLRQAAVDAAPARNHGGHEDDVTYNARIQAAWDGVAEPAFDNSDVVAGINALIEGACPYKALEKQKRFMRRKMRKPAGMTTRTYVNHIMHINIEELPLLPPFNPGQNLAADEIVDIVTFGIPKSWMKKMDEHDFDPFAGSIGELIAFCERMEVSEDFEKGSESKVAVSSSKSKKHKSQRNNPSKGKWCHYHETDTHDTKDCETLKKLKASRSSGSKPEYKSGSKNKTWKRKSDDAKSYSKKELASIAKKASQVALKQATKRAECNAVAKRKNDSDEESSAASASSDDASINVMETKMAEVDAELASFEFGKLMERSPAEQSARTTVQKRNHVPIFHLARSMTLIV